MQLPLHQVFVHRDGALVHRRGVVTVTHGNVIIDGLPLMMEAASLRVKMPDAEPLDVRLELDVSGRTRQDREELQAAWRAAARLQKRLEVELELRDEERTSLSMLVPSEPDDADDLTRPTAARLRSWLSAEDAVEPWIADLDIATTELRRQLEQAEEAADAARVALEEATHTPWHGKRDPSRRAIIRVEAEGDIEVRLSYRIQGATWTPAYALHADATFRRGRLVLRALVAQATGEDWSDVKVSLSTAPCSRRVGLPLLPALRLGSVQRDTKSPWRPLPVDLDALFPTELGSQATASPNSSPTSSRSRAPVEDDLHVGGPVPMSAGYGGGGGPPNEVSAEEAPARAKSKKRRKSARPAPAPQLAAASMAFGGAPPPAGLSDQSSSAPGPLAVSTDALNYPNLRLQGWESPQRGRLSPLDLGALAQEAGLPAEAATRVVRRRRSLAQAATDVKRITLPAHHVLPEPINGADFRYDAHEQTDIPSDGRFHSLSLQHEELELAVRYQAVPSLDPRVYRQVTGKRSEGIPLLPGPVDVFVDGSLSLTVPWGGTADGSALTFGLGVEEGLRVARNVRHREESTGLFSGGRRLFTEIDTELASSLSRSADVELIERVPISSEEGVAVKLFKATPEAQPYSGHDEGHILKGGKRQQLSVPAGGQREAHLAFYIDLPAKRELVGGDRRD